MNKELKQYIEKYKAFVTKSPLLASELEVALKWISYIVVGRFTHSPVVTEFIHSSSRLLSLQNDIILRGAAGISLNVDVTVERLQTFLTVLEYSETFAEVTARHLTGTKGKWLLIILIQCLKFTIRILLLFKYDQGIQRFPPIPPLNRRTDIPELSDLRQREENNLEETFSNVEVTFKLKTSGRVMRTLDAAPPLVSRTWKLPNAEETCNRPVSTDLKPLFGQYFAGELLHAARPLVHLTAMRMLGELSWKPWLLALIMDCTSLHWLKQSPHLTKKEKEEMSRRAFLMLLYLLRSPFYDQYSKIKILGILHNLSNSIPGGSLILKPLVQYIPEWQEIYSYAWSS